MMPLDLTPTLSRMAGIASFLLESILDLAMLMPAPRRSTPSRKNARYRPRLACRATSAMAAA